MLKLQSSPGVTVQDIRDNTVDRERFDPEHFYGKQTLTIPADIVFMQNFKKYHYVR